VPFVVEAFAFARDRERLARAGTGPEGDVVGDSGEAEGVAPDSNAGERVELRGAPYVFCRYLENAARIDSTGSDETTPDEVL
jgi:hypothetical protein